MLPKLLRYHYLMGLPDSLLQLPSNDTSEEPKPLWKYCVADWVTELTWEGRITHHLRIIECYLDCDCVRWYRIFDTTWARGKGDYEWRKAIEMEASSNLYRRPEAAQIASILERTQACQGLPYSIFKRTDCESLQNWIETGDESARWSPQVWAALAKGLQAVADACKQSQAQTRPTLTTPTIGAYRSK